MIRRRIMLSLCVVVAALGVQVGSVSACGGGSSHCPTHIGDPNSDSIGFFVPGGDQNFNTFGVFLPSQVPDSAGPNN